MRYRIPDSERQLSDIKRVRLNALGLHHICMMLQKGIQYPPRPYFLVWGESRSDLTKNQSFHPRTRILTEQRRACALALPLEISHYVYCRIIIAKTEQPPAGHEFFAECASNMHHAATLHRTSPTGGPERLVLNIHTQPFLTSRVFVSDCSSRWLSSAGTCRPCSAEHICSNSTSTARSAITFFWHCFGQG